MFWKLLKFSLVCVTGTLLLTTNYGTALAYEEPIAGYTGDKITVGTTNSGSGVKIESLNEFETPIPGYNNLGIANVDTNLLIRSAPGEGNKILGKLPKNGGCEVLEESKNGWTKITSGKVTGYVKSEYLITGVEAIQIGKKVGTYVATAKTDGLNVRELPSTTCSTIDQVAKGEELIVLDSKITTDSSDFDKWVKVSLDSDTSENGAEAYVAKDYVNINFVLIKAVSMEELESGTDASPTRSKLVNLAKKYIGELNYVWGGTSLVSGADCSGFTQALYRQLGYSIPRTSRSQAVGGTSIKSTSLKPGDLVFYGSSSYINHVAMYIGNGRVIHASNKRDDVKISNVNYRTPVRYARYIND